jgi:hypothetical protein
MSFFSFRIRQIKKCGHIEVIIFCCITNVIFESDDEKNTQGPKLLQNRVNGVSKVHVKILIDFT